MLTIINNATQHFAKTAIISNGQSYSYHDLWSASRHFASLLLENEKDLSEKRVAFMVTPSFDYVAVQWAIWQAGGVGVPLCTSYPLASLQYVIEDTATEIIVVSPQYKALLEPLTSEKNIRLIVLEEEIWANFQKMPEISDDALPNIETPSPRHDIIHERHYEFTKRSRDDSRQYRSANFDARRSMEMARNRPYIVHPAFAPCSWHYQCHQLCIMVWGYLRIFT